MADDGSRHMQLLLSLSIGAIMLIAAFIREPPSLPGTKYLVSTALFLFVVAFMMSFLAILSRIVLEKGSLTSRETRWYLGTLRITVFISGFSFFGGMLLMFYFTQEVIMSWP